MTPEEAEERECIAEDRAKGKKEDALIEEMEEAKRLADRLMKRYVEWKRSQ